MELYYYLFLQSFRYLFIFFDFGRISSVVRTPALASISSSEKTVSLLGITFLMFPMDSNFTFSLHWAPISAESDSPGKYSAHRLLNIFRCDDQTFKFVFFEACCKLISPMSLLCEKIITR